MSKSVIDGVLFSDGDLPGEKMGEVTAKISKQNALPSEIKRHLASKAKQLGANGVANLEIAQTAHHWIYTASPFKWDSESLVAVGIAVKIPKEKMQEAMLP